MTRPDPPTKTVEVESLAEFDARAAEAMSMRGWRIQSVDLSTRTDALLRLDPAGAVVLGSALDAEAEVHLRSGGALIFPAIPDVPFDPYRGGLYTPDELYAGLDASSYETTPDALGYVWSQGGKGDVAHTLAAALHDHAIDDALADHVSRLSAVGVMGGHAIRRDDPDYRTAAELGRSLARSGRLVVTGGGPGAMEAANLGAFVAPSDDDALDDALATLAAVPDFRPSVTAWARAAFAVRRSVPDGADSLGIPTWFYGHEPPNAFASSIAKYFQNALREDTLLRLCHSGIVFLPGAAGTVQEVFQAVCENYYADASSVAPMVLVGVEHWTEAVPAWPLLEALAADRAMAAAVHLVDAVEDVEEVLTRPL